MIVVDCETTGLDPERSSIVTLTAIEFDNPTNVFGMRCRVWPGAEVSDEALVVNGFDREDLYHLYFPSEAELIARYVAWAKPIEDGTLAGECVTFDRDFMMAAARRAKLTVHFGRRVVDLHTLSYIHHRISGRPIPIKNGYSALNLEATLDSLGLKPEGRLHTSHEDAIMELTAISHLLEEFQKSFPGMTP